MNVHLELGIDCLWVVTENVEVGQFDRRAYYPWEADIIAAEHEEADWLTVALDHLASISALGGA